MQVLSESASYEDAVSKYAWLKFTGSRGKEVTQRTHKRMIRTGDTFGLLPIASGKRYTLIFPDIPHIDFPVDIKTGMFLLERSDKLRKVPDVVQRENKTKTAGALTVERALIRTQFDAARFQPKRIPNEAVNGVTFDSYQWRIVPQNNYKLKTTKAIVTFQKNDMIGVRFKRIGKGGVVVNVEGMYLKVEDSEYDKLIADTNIMPIQDWPEGNVDAETVKTYHKSARRQRRRTKVEDAEAIRLAKRAEALERKQHEKELRKAQRDTTNAKSAELRDMRQKIRSGEIDAPVKDVNTVYQDSPELRTRGRNAGIIEHEELEEELDMELDENEQKLEDIIDRSPFAGDIFNIEDTVGSLFGGSDDHDEEHAPELDLSDIDEPEDDEEEPAPKSKVRSKKDKKGKPAVVEEAEEEEDPDAEEDTGDSDPDAADDEDGDSADDSADDDESVDDADADDAGDDEEDTDGEEDAEDADASDAVDETDAEEDGDSDVAKAEKEAAETAKKIAGANKSTPSARAEEAEEGDVVKFKADAKLQRDWLVVKVSSHTTSDNIVVYTLYDITNSPDEVRQVRINRARKQNLFDYAEHTQDMAPKLFNTVYDMVEDYPVNKDPIAS